MYTPDPLIATAIELIELIRLTEASELGPATLDELERMAEHVLNLRQQAP